MTKNVLPGMQLESTGYSKIVAENLEDSVSSSNIRRILNTYGEELREKLRGQDELYRLWDDISAMIMDELEGRHGDWKN